MVVHCHFFLQGIFPTQDQTPISCLSCIGRWVLYQPRHWWSPLIIIYVTKRNIRLIYMPVNVHACICICVCFNCRFIILKFIWNHERFQISKAIFRKNNKAGGIVLPDFRRYYKPRVVTTARHWHKTGTSVNRTEQQAQKWIHVCVQWERENLFSKW